MLGKLWDAVTDVAETAAHLTGNPELAELIDEIDDIVEDIIED